MESKSCIDQCKLFLGNLAEGVPLLQQAEVHTSVTGSKSKFNCRGYNSPVFLWFALLNFSLFDVWRKLWLQV
jgi:hypothetical protein